MLERVSRMTGLQRVADELREGWYSVTINIVISQGFRSTQQPRCVDPMPIQYWSDVADASPT